MVSSSSEGILTEYLVKYGAIQAGEKERPSELLETLYIADCYRAGQDLRIAREHYDTGMWNGVSASELDERLQDLSGFMATLARDRLAMYGVTH